MTNVIVDAGTDAKIAKFQKRGIELIDLAFLEPVEVWGEKEGRTKDTDVEKRMRRESMRLSVDEAGGVTMGPVRQKKSTASFAPSGSVTGPVALSATSSAVSLNSAQNFISGNGGSQGDHMSQQDDRFLRPSDSRASVRSDTKNPSPLSSSPITPTATSVSDQSAPTPTQKKNIFGKLFTKKNSGSAPSTPTITPTSTSHSSKQTEGLPSFASFSILQTSKTPQMTKQSPEASDESMLQTPTGPSKEKGHHGRNLSLTGITAPIKTTLKNNRNRLSGLVNGMTPLQNANALGALGIRDESAPQGIEKGRDASPNPSVAKSVRSRLSWVGAASTTTHSSESDHAPKEADITITGPQPQTYPLTLIPSYLEGTPTARQPQQQQLHLRPPVLGCQPSFSSMPSAPTTYLAPIASPITALSPRIGSEKDVENLLRRQRAMMYLWIVKKWLKKRVSTIFGGGEAIAPAMVGSLFGKKKEASAANGQEASGPGGVEVRFEWKRVKGKEAKRGRRNSRSRRKASGAGSIAGAGADSDGEVDVRYQSGDPSGRLKLEEKRRHRMSTGSFGTAVSEENGLGSSPGSKRMKREGDDGEESDPEDSETPWICTLRVKRSTAVADGGRISPIPSISAPGVVPLEPQVLRVKVGTLSPTPHHPKVVAMLKVPFPLPDVEVERMGVVKRGSRSTEAPSGADEDGDEREPYAGLTLTAEEIKDVVCSTGLWLVVREGFGGVGKVTRKGDGWRIRG